MDANDPVIWEEVGIKPSFREFPRLVSLLAPRASGIAREVRCPAANCPESFMEQKITVET